MRVTLIAHTTVAVDDEAHLPTTDQWMIYEMGKDFMSIPSADHVAEFAGRACYQSFDRPNPKTAKNAGYLQNIIYSQHFSVLEHASATFYIEGVSRSLTHELVRHRHLSFSQLSQRYVDEADADTVLPPGADEGLANGITSFSQKAQRLYAELVGVCLADGMPHKAARQLARAVLPNCTETKIVVTGNHRAWRDMLTKRLSPAADPEIRGLAFELLRQLKTLAPNTYQDFQQPPNTFYESV